MTRSALRGAVAAVMVFGLAAGPAAAGVAEVPATLTRLVDDERLAGGVAVVRDGPEVLWWSAGYADLPAGSRFVPHTRVRAASITKTFLAAVLLQLVGEGRVDLDAPVATYLPDRPGAAGAAFQRVTMRQLLSHRSGLPEFFGFIDAYGPPVTPEQLVGLAFAHGTAEPPGGPVHYTNTNFVVAGLVVQAVTGRAPADEITRRVIAPLGLRDTYFPAPGETGLREPFAHGYEFSDGRYFPAAAKSAHEPGELVDVTRYEASNSDMAGALVSTGEDLTAFVTALLDGRVVAPAELAQMTDTQPWDQPGPGYGYGLGLTSVTLPCGVTLYGHLGDLFGYHTVMMKPFTGPALSVTFTQSAPPGVADPRDRLMDALYCSP